MPVLLLLPLLVALPERDLLLLTEALAPGEREAVGLPLSVLLPLRVLDGVGAAVPVLLLLCVPVGVGEALLLAVRLLLLLSLPVEEGLAPWVSEAVGEADRELLRLAVLEGVACAVPLPV